MKEPRSWKRDGRSYRSEARSSGSRLRASRHSQSPVLPFSVHKAPMPGATDVTDPTCLFCRIVRGEIPAKLVASNEHCVAFRDINPQAPLHVLVIPREHVATLNDASDPSLVGRLALMAAAIARDEGFSERGYRTVINTNSDAGQTVFHIHLHLLAGRKLAWPPG